jgi:DNA-binding transcriptional LysR family regulator
MDVWEVPQSSRSGLDRGFLMDVGPTRADGPSDPRHRERYDGGNGPRVRWIPGIAVMVEPLPASGLPELPHLSTFARAAEQGSFTAAAAQMGITQAAVSQRIATLEGELRGSLFDRRAGRISLTEAGQRLYQFARQILDLHDEARRDLGGFHPPVSGDLPTAASSVPGECFLPALLSAFHATHPQVHVRATVSDSGSVIKNVEKGRATLGLVGQKAERPGFARAPGPLGSSVGDSSDRLARRPGPGAAHH